MVIQYLVNILRWSLSLRLLVTFLLVNMDSTSVKFTNIAGVYYLKTHGNEVIVKLKLFISLLSKDRISCWLNPFGCVPFGIVEQSVQDPYHCRKNIRAMMGNRTCVRHRTYIFVKLGILYWKRLYFRNFECNRH